MEKNTEQKKVIDAQYDMIFFDGRYGNPKQDIVFLNWFLDKSQSGYFSLLDLDGIADMVDRIADFYEIKFPNDHYSEGEVDSFYPDETTFAMTLTSLKARLTPAQKFLFENRYRMGSGSNLINNSLTFKITDDRGVDHILHAYNGTGIIIGAKENLSGILGEVPDTMTLEELYIFLSSRPAFDFHELKRILMHHMNDETLRKLICNFATITMRMNARSPEKVSLARASRWLKELKSIGIETDLSDPELWDDWCKTELVQNSTRKVASTQKKLQLQIAKERDKHFTQKQ